MVAVAELEAGLTGERTRAALAQAKKRGVRLGNPRLSEVAGMSWRDLRRAGFRPTVDSRYPTRMSLRMSRRKWAKMSFAERAAEEAAHATAERGVTTRARKVVEIWNARTEERASPSRGRMR